MPISPFIIYSGDASNDERTISEIKKGLNLLNVKDLMIENVICVEEDTLIKDIAKILVEKGIKRVPVLRNEKIVGIVTRQDIIEAVQSLF